MEDTHREVGRELSQKIADVLILVLMEDTHRDFAYSLSESKVNVLILVLMEDTHRAGPTKVGNNSYES